MDLLFFKHPTGKNLPVFLCTAAHNLAKNARAVLSVRADKKVCLINGGKEKSLSYR